LILDDKKVHNQKPSTRAFLRSFKDNLKMPLDKPGQLLKMNRRGCCLWRENGIPVWINHGEFVLFLGLYPSKLSRLKACFLTLCDGYLAECEVGKEGDLAGLEEIFSFPVQFNTLTDNADKIKL